MPAFLKRFTVGDVDFLENQILFGRDKTEGIVAVEFREPSSILIYSREPKGKTQTEAVGLQPFLWVGQDIGSCETLDGNLPYRFLRHCESWGEFSELRNELKRSGIAYFALSDPVQQYLLSTGRTLFKGMPFESLRRLQLDIETTCADDFLFSHADRDPIAAIALSDSSGWEELLLVDCNSAASEKKMLERLSVIIAERDPDVIEGHNIFKFDLPYIATRAKKHKVPLPWGRDGSPLAGRSSRLLIAEKTIQYTRYEIHGRHIVDTFLLAQYYDVGTRELESFGLKSVAKHFGISEKDRVILNGAEIQKAYLENPESLRTYALQDVRETRALATVLSASYFIQAQIFPYNYQDVIVRGNATRIDSLFLREYLHRKHSLPECPAAQSFEGGYTDIFFTGVKRDIWHCDVTSLYPSVMLQFGLLPASDELQIFRSLLSSLRTFRLEAKAKMRAAKAEAEQRHYEALQNTFKILINSFYGYLGFAQGHFADFDAAAAVTAKGRELLKAMVDWLQKQGAEVIEIDTDGIYFHPPEGAKVKTLEEGMREILPEGIDVEFGRQYRAMFSYKAKNYALLDEDGKITIKGAALKSRGLERFQRDFLQTMIRHFLEGEPNRILDIRADYEQKIRNREWPIEQLMKTETLQDTVASYQKKIGASSRNKSAAFELAIQSGRNFQAGDQVSYYVTGTKKKVTAYENAKMIEQWSADNRDENIEYYVGKLDELLKKFSEFLDMRDPNQPTLL